MGIEQIICGDCIEKLKELPDNSVDSIVTDPPYELGFMGKSWDNTGVAYNKEMWKEGLRVLKPGGHLLSFGGTRTYHRMACAIEDAGFEIRDMVEWMYGSGFPKSLNIGKAVDKIQGNERGVLREEKEPLRQGGNVNWDMRSSSRELTRGTSEWEGWGTALKPAHESICMARKPIEGTVANNVLKYGTGGLNIDKSRVGTEVLENGYCAKKQDYMSDEQGASGGAFSKDGMNVATGRFPANLIHDGSDEVVEMFPDSNGSQTTKVGKTYGETDGRSYLQTKPHGVNINDSGSVSRFFYCAKASKSERNKGCEELEKKENAGSYQFKEDGSLDGKPTDPKSNFHPTVKPIALMEYLIKMVTPKGGIVLDPFAGSGTTLVAAKELGYDFIGIEKEPEYIKIIEARVAAAQIPNKLL